MNGAADKTTTFAVGRLDEETGLLKPGSYTIGEGEIAGGVAFKTAGTLKLAADAGGVSSLVVNGAFTLSGNDELQIVGPTDSFGLTPGVYEIVKTTEPMETAFKTITYNGDVLPKNLKVTSTDTQITLRVSPKGMVIIIL